MSYWRLFYHIVWATKDREPHLTEPRVGLLARSIQAICTDERVLLHAIGGMPDHIHIAVSIPPRIAIAEFVRQLKGATSRRFNTTAAAANLEHFDWQPEYGVLSFSEDSLPTIVSYIDNQRAHHAGKQALGGIRADRASVRSHKLAKHLAPEGLRGVSTVLQCRARGTQLTITMAVEVGGTFTDVIWLDEQGEVRTLKVPSVPSDPAVGVIAGLEEALRGADRGARRARPRFDGGDQRGDRAQGLPSPVADHPRLRRSADRAAATARQRLRGRLPETAADHPARADR